MRSLLISTVLCLATFARADAFPWADGAMTLTDQKGQTLVWTIARSDGEVRITGTHPKWKVEHRAKPDGTPLSTVKRAEGNTTKVTYSSEGAQLERTDAKGKVTTFRIKEKGLWDGDSLDVRLAGLPWSKGRKQQMRIVDIDAADGSTLPMVAEYVGEEKVGESPCQHVHLALDDFRRMFAPTFEYRYATAAGAKYLQHDGDGLTFIARQ